MIDLSTLQAGDRVKLRGGMEIELDNPIFPEGTDYFSAQIIPDTKPTVWFRNGNFLFNEGHPFDIIEIIPKPFDWKDVKPGQCFQSFEDENGEGNKHWYYFYVGQCPFTKQRIFASRSKSKPEREIVSVVYDDAMVATFVRTPSHDLQL